MAVFSGKEILHAVFTNNANDTIEVVYNHKDEGEPAEYISVWLPATDPNNPNFKALQQEGWSLAKIQRATHTYLQDVKKMHDDRIQREVKTQVDKYYAAANEEMRVKLEEYYAAANEEMRVKLEEYYAAADSKVENIKEQVSDTYQLRYKELVDAKTITSPTKILQNILQNNTDEEILFKTKLAIFELQEVKSLSDRALKQNLRTSKSLMQLFGVLDNIMKLQSDNEQQ